MYLAQRTVQGPHPRPAGERVSSTCTSNVTRMNRLSSSMSRPVCLQHSTATHHMVDATLHLHNLRVLVAGTEGHESVTKQCAKQRATAVSQPSDSIQVAAGCSERDAALVHRQPVQHLHVSVAMWRSEAGQPWIEWTSL